MTGIIVIAFSL